MKKLLFYSGTLIIIMLFCASCVNHVDPDPPSVEACFATQYSNYSVGEVVYFNNCSSNAESYSWDFDDGFYSNENHPNHSFSSPGTYQVQLTAYGINSRSDYATLITVTGSTDLDILILYLGTEDPVSDCTVTLYGSEDDWNNFSNPIINGNTDSNGSIIFANLETLEYYMDAYKSVDETHYYSNEQQGYVTDQLIENEVNMYNIYVELLESSGKSKSRKNKYVIRKIEKRK